MQAEELNRSDTSEVGSEEGLSDDRGATPARRAGIRQFSKSLEVSRISKHLRTYHFLTIAANIFVGHASRGFVMRGLTSTKS